MRELEAVDSHTEGEPTRIVTDGLPEIPGATMRDRRAWLRDNLDHVRTGLVREPRGHDAIVLAYLMPPVDPRADAGVVFANDVGYLNMCGHGAIGVATTLVATGRVTPKEPRTTVVLETPVGIVEAEVEVQAGRPVATTIRNVPAFVLHRETTVDVPGHGAVAVDIAYGGNWFAITSAEALGVAVRMENLAKLTSFADALRAAVGAAGLTGFDPETGDPLVIDHIEVFESAGERSGRTFTLCPGIAYDRSPCGTGTSAKLALLHARGEMRVGDVLTNRSIVGTAFTGTILAETEAAGRPAIVPAIRGSAWITAFPRFVFDAADPLVWGIA